MFGRNRNQEPTASADSIDALQRGVDAKEQAEAMLEEIRLDALLTPEGHLWLRDDNEQVAASLAVVAYVNDRFAEVLYANAVERAKDPSKLPEDVVTFGSESSRVALEKIAEARSYKSNVDYVFDEDTRVTLAAENQLPYWPRFTDGYDDQQPDWMAPAGPAVSDAFLMGTLAAGRELCGWVDSLQHDANGGVFNNAAREITEGIGPYLQQQLQEAVQQLDVAEGLASFQKDRMIPPNAQTADAARRLMFTSLHDGLIAVYQVAISTMIPQLLHDDFGAMRADLR